MRSSALAVLPRPLPLPPSRSPDSTVLPLLSPTEQCDLLAVARAALPLGQRLPAVDADTIRRLDDSLQELPASHALGYRAALHTLGGLGWLRYQRRLRDLDRAAMEQLLAWLYHGDFARRGLLRLLLTPLKQAYFDSPPIFALLGERYRGGSVSESAVRKRVVPTEQPRYVHERTRLASDIGSGETIDCDVVVIGSGAGGAVAAYELAAAGQAVLLLEEGLFFGRSDFVGSTTQMQRLLYRDLGMSFAFGNNAILLPTGRTVGGTTTVNSGTCYRMPERIFARWQELGLDEYSSAALRPYYERVESVLGVAPAAAGLLGGSASMIAEGASRLGFRHTALRRNAPDCDGQGLCCLGCPTDAKRSTNVSYVPLALQAGANLIVGAHAERLLIEGGRAVGVEVTARFPAAGTRQTRSRFSVRSRAVVLAAGALNTPVFLLSDPAARRALGRSDALGNHLTIHPAAGMFAISPTPIQRGPAIPQSYAIEQFHDEGLLMEGVATPLDLTALTLPLFGRPFVDAMESYEHLASFGFMIEDAGGGSVRPGPGGRPLVHYNLQDQDLRRLQRGVDLLAQIYFAGQARRVITPVRGFEVLESLADLARLRQAELKPADFELSAYHPLGTAHMGRDPAHSVVDQDLAAHDLPGLYICDGSVLPTSPAVNPQLTIMALASRAAQRLAARLG